MLAQGGELHVVGLGDSIVNDTFRSAWLAKLAEAVAPLPPVAATDLAGIGRTNDAILYGARVTLWVRGDDESLAQVVQDVPSCASQDFGEPFAELFARYDHDFYKIDPQLFSPAVVNFVNVDSGRSFRFGATRAARSTWPSSTRSTSRRSTTCACCSRAPRSIPACRGRSPSISRVLRLPSSLETSAPRTSS